VLKHLQARDDWSEKSLSAKGFTLIELLVVIIILGILAGVAIFAVGNISDNSKKTACETEKDTVENAIAAYEAQYDNASPTLAQLKDTASPAGNLKKTPKYWTVAGGAPSAVGTLPTGCS
jgi:prepilin-type N-terminal cleavage/methylation domain-containing protein